MYVIANRGKGERLKQVRETLAVTSPAPIEAESVEAFMLRVVGIDIHRCPCCGEGRRSRRCATRRRQGRREANGHDRLTEEFPTPSRR